MPIVVLVFKVIFEAIRVLRKKANQAKQDPLCVSCTHAHVQYGTNARRAISCTYYGTIREMKLDVLYCTDYRDRDAPVRTRAVGFVREIESGEPP